MSNQFSNILVTGAAGFIGFHLSKRLSSDGYNVIGIDNVNDYYDVDLKEARLKILEGSDNFSFHRIDLNDDEGLKHVFDEHQIDVVINLAAQAGVRHSLEHPDDYVHSNISGFVKLIHLSKIYAVKHFMYASSASVYGANKSLPFNPVDSTDHPISLYAATKKSNELIAHSYSALYNIPVTGLRFFSVYGPYGRPDMALFLFTKAIIEQKQMDVFNHGKMKRSFTYVDDAVESVLRLMEQPPVKNEKWDGLDRNPSESFAAFQVFNVGNDELVELYHYIELIETKLGKKAIIAHLPMQLGDIAESRPDLEALNQKIDYRPTTPIKIGISNFVDWYLDYYQVNK